MPQQTSQIEKWPLCEGCYYFRENECGWDIHSSLGVDECYVSATFKTPLERKLSESKLKGKNVK